MQSAENQNRKSGAIKAGRARRASRRAFDRLGLEALENRQLLSLTTTTTLAASAATLPQGQSLTLTATVSDGDPVNGGTVTFTDGSSSIGTGTVTNGTATLTISNLAVGRHQLGASYGGQTGDSPSTANSGFIQAVVAVSHPADVAVDSSGNLYIVEETNNEVVKVTPGGTTTVVAGNGTSGYSGDGGQATAAKLNSPRSVALDSSGNLYIADGGNYAVRKVSAGGVITTVAGNGSYGYSGDGGQATAAKLGTPTGVAVDSSGNLYVVDSSNSAIRKVSAGGVITTVAGNGTSGYSGDGGQATAAELSFPTTVAADASGNLYIVDNGNEVVRKVSAGGVITTVAGTHNSSGFSGDGGPATSAKLAAPYGVAVDASGDIFISDGINNRVREVTTDGTIKTYAGDGTSGDDGDDGPATSASVSPFNVATDSGGNLFIEDFGNNVIREVIATLPFTVTAPLDYLTVTGISGSVAAGTTQTITVTDHNADNSVNTGYTGTVHFTSTDPNAVLPADATLVNGVGTFNVTFETAKTQSVTATDTVNSGDTGSEGDITVTPGPATYFTVSNGAGVAAGGVEAESVTAYDQYGNVATGYAGTVHITSSDAQAVLPADATLADGVGSFDVTLRTAGSQSITATDAVAPAITGTQDGLAVTPGPAASLAVTGAVPGAVGSVEPVTVTAKDAYGNVATGYAGTVHFTSSDGSAVLPADSTLTGGMKTFLVTLETLGAQSITATDTDTSAINGSETGIAIAYPTATTLSASASSPTTVQSLTLTATVATVTGQSTPDGGTVSFYQGSTLLGTVNVSNGTATYTINRLAAGSYSFSAVYSGVSGLYLGGYAGLTGQSTIRTVAGNGTQGNTGDGGQATAAKLDLPSGIVFDAAGNLYIADPGAHVVRKVTPAGVISTYAGTGTAGDTGDGGQATAARLYDPYGLAFDSGGNLYIADDGSNVVRKVTPAGIISTVAGNGTGGSTGNGGQATAAELDEPTGVAVDASGNIFIADSYNNEIREVTTDGVIHDFAGTGTVGNSGDGGQATAAQLHDPYMVAVYGGNVYFTDFGNSKVREVTPDGVIRTVAGTGTGGDTGDGGPATSAEIDGPIGLAFNAVGDLFIADYDDSTVRVVTGDGNIHTVAGSHDAFEYGSSKGDGGPGAAAGFYYLQGLAVDAAGDLYIADNYNASIRELGPAIGVNVTQAPASHFTVTASPAGATAGTQQTVTVTALDADGNTVTNYAGTVHITSSDGQAALPVNAGLTNGVGTFLVTLKTAGTETITATDTASSSLTGSDASDLITSGSATHLVVGGATDEAAGGVEAVTVTAYDAYGNVAAGYAGTVHVTSSDGRAALPADAALVGGVGTFQVTLKTAGSDSITATDAGDPGITGSETGLAITPGSATHLVLTGATDEAAGGVEAVTVTAYDAYGNVAAGYAGTVHVTSSDGRAALPADAALVGGVGTFQVTLKTAGSDSITATDAGDPGITGSETGLVVSPGEATHLTVTGGTAGNTGRTEAVTVTAYDAYGNVATGYDGTVHVTSTDGRAALPGDAGLTHGVGTFPVTLETAGVQSITATDTAAPSITGSETGLAITPGPATHLVVSGATGEAAGGVETVTVTAYDAYGNVATAYVGTVHITSSDGRAALPANAGLPHGVGTFPVTLETAGVQSITATDTAAPSITGSETGLAITPGPATHLVVSGATAVAAGGVETVTVTAYDAYGNVADGYAGTVHITSSDAGATLPPSAELSNGVATFAVTFGTGGTRSLTVTDATDGGLTGTASITVYATVSGRVYLDLNADGSPEAGEPGLAGRVVYLDLNHDGKLDPGDPTATTAANGGFTLRSTIPGPAAVVEATGQDTAYRHVVDQIKVGADGSVTIGVVPISPVAPVKVVPSPFSTSPATDANAAYVQSLYRAVLGRVGSNAEVSGWLAKMQAGMGRSQVAAGFVNSVEHRQDEVATFYEEFFHRAPDPSSVFWVHALRSGVSEEAVVGSILDSKEYQSEHRDSASFVRDLYLDVLGRQGEATGVAGWQSALASGASRQSVVASFLRSPEAIDQLVESDYTAFLHRPREQGAKSAAWARMLEGPNGSATTVAVGILDSPEFVKDSTTPRR